MTEFMAQDSNDLLRLTLLNQRVVDNNVLLPRESIKVGIAMSTALATINHIQLGKREVELLSQILDTSLEITSWERRKLIEQRQDKNGIQRDGENLDKDTKKPEIVEE